MKDKIDWNEIEKEVLELCNDNPEIRKGTSYYWIIWSKHPIIANEIMDTEFDCYYEDNKIEIFKNMCDKLFEYNLYYKERVNQIKNILRS